MLLSIIMLKMVDVIRRHDGVVPVEDSAAELRKPAESTQKVGSRVVISGVQVPEPTS